MVDSAFAKAAHLDSAGWALGTLDPGDRERFEAHLPSCPDCQQAVAEFGSTALMLKTALPAVELMARTEPPADLQARTLASVKRAARKAAGGRRNARLLLAAAAAAVVATVAGITLTLARPAPTLAFDIPLHALYAGPASGEAVAHQTADGWSIQLTVHDLKPLGSGRFYECWYAGPATSQAALTSSPPAPSLSGPAEPRPSRCGAPPTLAPSPPCRSPPNKQATPDSTARSSSPAPPASNLTPVATDARAPQEQQAGRNHSE